MRTLRISLVFLGLALLISIALSGCNSSPTAFVPNPSPTPTPTPTPTPSPTSQPAQAPMGSFIEDLGTVSSSISQRIMYAATNDGTGLSQIGSQGGDFHSVYVLADGSKGVFAAQALDGYSQISSFAPVDTTIQPIQLTSSPIDKTSAMLSADGSKIVFLQLNPIQNDPDGHALWDVAVMDAQGNNLYVIPRPQGWYVSHPFLSPDGKTIVMALDQGAFGDAGIFTMNVDGTALTRLSPGGANGILAFAPAFSPDGKQIAFSSIGWNDLSIYLINSDGTGLQHIGQPNSGAGDPLFVGDRIMYVAASQIYSMKLDGTGVVRVTNNHYKDGFEVSVF